MDGFRSIGAPGILYAEDFGLEPVIAPDPPAPAPAPPPALTQVDIDAACIHAVQAASLAWADSAAERRTVALEALAETLGQARIAAVQQAEAFAQGLAAVSLGMVSSALPHFCRVHGDAEVRALLARMLPILARRQRVVVRVHAGLIDTIRTDLATLDDDLIDSIEIRAANLEPGDTRLSWADGNLTRDSAALCAAITDSLAECGLLTPAPPFTDESHAIAQ